MEKKEEMGREKKERKKLGSRIGLLGKNRRKLPNQNQSKLTRSVFSFCRQSLQGFVDEPTDLNK